MDNNIVFGKTIEQQIHNLEIIFQMNQLQGKFKTNISLQRKNFGHIVEKEEILALKSNVEDIIHNFELTKLKR